MYRSFKLYYKECYTACFIDQEEQCLKDRTVRISCNTIYAEQSEICAQPCENSTDIDRDECEINSPRLIDCYEITEQKSRMQRKIEALKRAIEVYLDSGTTYPPTHYSIHGDQLGCTTAYSATNPLDEYAKEYG